jgi:hypothetical protein
VDLGSGRRQLLGILNGFRCGHRATRGHQSIDQNLALVGSKPRVAGPPQSPADDDIAAIGRDGGC